MLIILIGVGPLQQTLFKAQLAFVHLYSAQYMQINKKVHEWLSDKFLHFVNLRCRYLSNAVLQAKNASNSNGLVGSTQASLDSGMLDLLEGKLAVLRFQIKIKEELEAIASRLEASPGASESMQNDPPENDLTADASIANAAREKAKELSLELKSITQLYNEYAVPFELWEVLSFLA